MRGQNLISVFFIGLLHTVLGSHDNPMDFILNGVEYSIVPAASPQSFMDFKQQCTNIGKEVATFDTEEDFLQFISTADFTAVIGLYGVMGSWRWIGTGRAMVAPYAQVWKTYIYTEKSCIRFDVDGIHTHACNNDDSVLCQEPRNESQLLCNAPYPLCPGVQYDRWTRVNNAVVTTIDVTHNNISSIDMCRGLCVQEVVFYCRAFDYFSNKTCRLSASNESITVSETMVFERRSVVERDMVLCFNVEKTVGAYVGDDVPAQCSLLNSYPYHINTPQDFQTLQSECNMETVWLGYRWGSISLGFNDSHTREGMRWNVGTIPYRLYPDTDIDSSTFRLVKNPADKACNTWDCSGRKWFYEDCTYSEHRIMCERPTNATKIACDAAIDVGGANKMVHRDRGYVIYNCNPGLRFHDMSRTKLIYCPCAESWKTFLDGLGHCAVRHEADIPNLVSTTQQPTTEIPTTTTTTTQPPTTTTQPPTTTTTTTQQPTTTTTTTQPPTTTTQPPTTTTQPPTTTTTTTQPPTTTTQPPTTTTTTTQPPTTTTTTTQPPTTTTTTTTTTTQPSTTTTTTTQPSTTTTTTTQPPTTTTTTTQPPTTTTTTTQPPTSNTFLSTTKSTQPTTAIYQQSIQSATATKSSHDSTSSSDSELPQSTLPATVISLDEEFNLLDLILTVTNSSDIRSLFINTSQEMNNTFGDKLLDIVDRLRPPFRNESVYFSTPELHIETGTIPVSALENLTFTSQISNSSVNDVTITIAGLPPDLNILYVYVTFIDQVFKGDPPVLDDMLNPMVHMDFTYENGTSIGKGLHLTPSVNIRTRGEEIKEKTFKSERIYNNIQNNTRNHTVVTKFTNTTYTLQAESGDMRIALPADKNYTVYLSQGKHASKEMHDCAVEYIDGLNVPECIWDADVEIQGASVVIFLSSHDITSTLLSIYVQEVSDAEIADQNYIEPEVLVIGIIKRQTAGNFMPVKHASRPERRHKRSSHEEEVLISKTSKGNSVDFTCNFLGTMTADLFYPPNTINFETVFDDFLEKIADNWYVLAMIFACLSTYVILMLVLYYMDNRDRFMFAYLPLVNNAAWHDTFYRISIYTGSKGQAIKKDVAVNITIIGTNGFTGPRKLHDSYRKNFQKGTTSNFLLSTFGSLGKLESIKISIEESEDVKWHVEKILIADLSFAERYYFHCDTVLDSEKKSTDLIPLALEHNVKNFRSLITDHTKQGIFDDHLWFSAFKRPTYSHFTRVQRLSCCVSALFLTMVASCMWYRTGEDVGNIGFQLGPFLLTWQAVYTGTLTTLMVLPINMALAWCFQNVKPQIVSFVEKERDALKELQGNRKGCVLPRMIFILVWIVLVLSILGSAFFCFLYSMEWGPEVSKEWLLSIIIGTAESVFVIQLMKVFILAIFFSVMSRMPCDDLEGGAANTYIWRTPEDSAKVKQEKQLDKKLGKTVRSITLAIIYLIILMFIAMTTADVSSFLQNSHLQNSIMPGPYSPVKKVQTFNEFYDWLNEVVLPQVSTDISHEDDDFLNLGPARLILVRHPGDCRPPPIISNVVHSCRSSSLLSEDTLNYTPGWIINGYGAVNDTQYVQYVHHSAKELGNILTNGQLTSYSGGGYTSKFYEMFTQSKLLIEKLQKSEWLGKMTKAVILQYTIYNGNINLFTQVKVLAEVHDAGRVFLYPRIQSFKLYTYVGPTGILTLVLQSVWLLLLLYFIVNEVVQVVKEGKRYVKSIWTMAYWLHLTLAVASAVVFAVRIPKIMNAIETLKNEKGTFVSFDELAFLDETLNTILAFVLFFAFLDLLKFFQFLKDLSQLLGTIKHAVESLISFSVIFMLGLLEFAFLFYFVLGHEYEGFSSVRLSLITLFSSILGKFSKDIISFDESPIGGIIFMVFSLVMVLILFDMFISILTDTYDNVRRNPHLAPYDAELMAHIKKRWQEWKISMCGNTGNKTMNENIMKEKEPVTQVVRRLSYLEQSLQPQYDNWQKFMAAAAKIIIHGERKIEHK